MSIAKMKICGVHVIVFLASCVFAKFSFGRRIVGGRKVDIENVPYQVSLLYKGYHSCGGAFIAKDFVLTAAHCISMNTKSLSVRAGSSVRDKGGIIIKVEKVMVHPSFNRRSLDYDFAILKLEKYSRNPFNKTYFVKLPEQGEEKTGKNAFVSGWGMTSEKEKLSDELMGVVLRVINTNDCKKFFPEISDRMICAGDIAGGKDSCQGDSGGPMVVDNTLIGIVSWGIGCGRPNLPGVYSKVSSVRQWINKMSGV